MLKFTPPIGILNTVKDWISLIRNQQDNKVFFKDIYPAALFKKHSKHPPARYPKRLEGGYVSGIPNGRVWGLNGAIITPDHYLIWEVSWEKVNPQTDHPIFKEKTLPDVTAFKGNLADLTHIDGRNYYHWMYETLPRIHLIRQSGLTADSYIMKAEQTPIHFHNESLGILGVEEGQIIKTNTAIHIQADNLIVPSQPAFATKWAYDFLRRTFLTKIGKISKKKRIYISRKWSRKIINEDELMELLASYHFIKVELEHLSIRKQAELFANSEAIIAPHGAGLTNLTFCSPSTKVIEIFSPTYITSLFWVISSFGQLKYHYFIGNHAGRDAEYLNWEWTGVDNIEINIRKFKKLLETIGF
ncbi:glycosyltransferase family 61 protein [Neobacillus notoginsengisoli]|uniref:Glycosyltransferase family 61 protein n=1 Tax=Neobacillus notoginsengisoli TaxID=1578198 RepID=A0A417Z198_9BACI|nr:glycosyltransferase family 61 protein [Neobacillus notoginsengisoli]RHW43571.1 glycosyltransferase family 61 protein [Neobacillus notoginsengisoli]